MFEIEVFLVYTSRNRKRYFYDSLTNLCLRGRCSLNVFFCFLNVKNWEKFEETSPEAAFSYVTSLKIEDAKCRVKKKVSKSLS